MGPHPKTCLEYHASSPLDFAPQSGNLQHAEGLELSLLLAAVQESSQLVCGLQHLCYQYILVLVFNNVINPKTFHIIKIQKHLKTQKDGDLITNVSPM
jgi:hypothetical protein